MIREFNAIMLVLILIGPYLVTVLFALLKIEVPTEFTIYTIVLFSAFVVKLNNNQLSMTFLKHKLSIMFLLFFIMLVLYTHLSISSNVSGSKFIIFFYIVVLKIFVLSTLNYKMIFCKYLKFIDKLKSFSIFILLIYFTLFYLGFTEFYNEDNREILMGTRNPIWFSRFISDLMFVVLFYILLTKKATILQSIVLVFGILLLFESGSRGPFIALLAVSIFSFANNMNQKFKKLIYVIFLLSGIPIFLLMSQYFININPYSLFMRIDQYSKSLDFISANVLGYGFGSFGFIYFGDDINFYPHNIFLEIFIELGVFTLIIFCIFLYYVFKSYNTKNIFFYLFLIAFINSQFSGDIPANGLVFIYGFLSVLFYRNINRFEINRVEKYG